MILYPPKTQIAFHLFDYPIYFYGIIMATAIVFGVILSSNLFKKFNPKEEYEAFENSFFKTIVFSIFGARLFYVLGNFSFYRENLKEIVHINHGGISIWGAILFGILSIFLYTKYNKKNFLKYLDYYSISLPICQAIGRFGNYFNQEAYGKPSVQEFIKLFVSEENRLLGFQDFEYFEPTFLYESILNLVLFLILLLNFKNNKNKNGLTFFYYILGYSIIRFLIESIRIDSVLNIFNLAVAQWISIFGFLVSIIFIYKIKNAPKNQK